MSAGPKHIVATQQYTTLTISIGAGLLFLRLPALHFDQPFLFWALLTASILLSASKLHLPLAHGKASLSMSYFTDFLALLMLGPDMGMLVTGASGVTQCMIIARGRPTVRQTLFSVAALMIAMQVTGLAATLLGGFSTDSTSVALKRVFVVAVVFFLVNSFLVAKAVALSRSESTPITWYRDFLYTAPACFIGAALALLLSRASSAFIWAPVLAAGPLYVTFRAYQMYLAWVEKQRQHVKELSDLHLATVEALARAIDARDQTIDHAQPGENHIRRVQAWATSLAEAAGMSPPEVEAVKVAALLHDIGKLAVPEHILSKPGRLTPKEFACIRVHPVVGAEIIKGVPFPYPVAPLIRSHHERWDGSGYPDGLWGPETPLGARILAVVDYFDALSSTRPYHEAVKRHEAIAILISEAGRALDPTLVELFLNILPTLQQAGSVAPVVAAPQVTTPDRSAPITGFSDETGRSVAPSSVFHNISLATHEMRALHDIAQTLGTRLSVDDTMALLTSKLNRLIPGSCWVLYLHDRAEDVLRCRFATGLAAETISRLTIPVGEGPSGWAARNRKAVRNGRAAADFEAAGVAFSGRPFHSALSYPLVDDEGLIGTLTIYHVEQDPFREEHRHVLDHISVQAASVLRNAVAYERMRDVSLTDPLTELPNSRALADFLRRHVVEAPVGGGASALLMIDLDDFKAVNDGHGHQKGDAALQAVAATIRGHVRASDFCARYGGDEFVVVLSGCDRGEADQRARDLQTAVGRVWFESAKGAPLRLGISVGVSVFPDDGITIDALITAADRRMYLDKSARRALNDIDSLSASS